MGHYRYNGLYAEKVKKLSGVTKKGNIRIQLADSGRIIEISKDDPYLAKYEAIHTIESEVGITDKLYKKICKALRKNRTVEIEGLGIVEDIDNTTVLTEEGSKPAWLISYFEVHENSIDATTGIPTNDWNFRTTCILKGETINICIFIDEQVETFFDKAKQIEMPKSQISG